MKFTSKWIAWLLICCLTAGCMGCAAAEGMQEAYQWPDDKLRGAVENSLLQTMGWMYLINPVNIDDPEVLRTQVQYLDLTGLGYTELLDLSIFESLQVLVAAQNPIDNIDALDGNANITAVCVNETNVTKLPHLPALKSIGIINTEIQNIAYLKELPDLISLVMGHTDKPVTEAELDVIDACAPQLTELYLVASRFDHLPVLEKCPNLSSLHLEAREEGSTFTDAEKAAIGKMPLTKLAMINTDLKDIEFIRTADRIRTLDLTGNQITDISALRGFSSLRQVWLNKNRIMDINPLGGSLHMMLEILNVSDNQIADLSVLDQAASLREADFSNNQITDISALAKHWNPGQLGKLRLGGNQISDLSVLSKFTNLQVLSAENNQIESVKALTKLTNLQELDLSGNLIADIKPLSTLKNLVTLKLNSNQITDPAAVSKLTALTTFELYDNPVDEKKAAAYPGSNLYMGTKEEYDRLDMPYETDCQPLLDALTAAQGEATYRAARDCLVLEMPDAGLTELPDLSAFKSLQGLNISGNCFEALPQDWTELTALSIGETERPLTEAEWAFVLQNKNLKMLWLHASELPDMTEVKGNKAIEQLHIRGNGKTEVDLSAFAKHQKIARIELMDASVESLKPIAEWKKLNEAAIYNCTLGESVLSQLSKKTGLELLLISGCGIEDVSALARLTKLEVLNLSDNQITDISPLAKLTKLVQLNLKNNQLTDISALAKLTKLQNLDLRDNQIEDTSAVTGLENLVELLVEGNTASK